MEENKELILKRVKDYHYSNNLVGMESIIRQAEREFIEDQKFISELYEYLDDLAINNFMKSLGNNTYGFQLFMLKFREKLIEDIKSGLIF